MDVVKWKWKRATWDRGHVLIDGLAYWRDVDGFIPYSFSSASTVP
jgi:hypothetical protein